MLEITCYYLLFVFTVMITSRNSSNYNSCIFCFVLVLPLSLMLQFSIKV